MTARRVFLTLKRFSSRVVGLVREAEVHPVRHFAVSDLVGSDAEVGRDGEDLLAHGDLEKMDFLHG